MGPGTALHALRVLRLLRLLQLLRVLRVLRVLRLTQHPVLVTRLKGKAGTGPGAPQHVCAQTAQAQQAPAGYSRYSRAPCPLPPQANAPGQEDRACAPQPPLTLTPPTQHPGLHPQPQQPSHGEDGVVVVMMMGAGPAPSYPAQPLYLRPWHVMCLQCSWLLLHPQ